jgi:hypothetical protein
MYSATLGVIADARGHRRRRCLVGALVAICAVAAAGSVFSQSQSPQALAPAVGTVKVVAPANVLWGAPSMGVACRSHSCRQVGLAVWLRRPAASVSATVAGHPLTLAATNAYPRRGAGAAFVGYLGSYRLITRVPLMTGPGSTAWDTHGDWPSARVQLRIGFAHGRILVTRLEVPLQPGWG